MTLSDDITSYSKTLNALNSEAEGLRVHLSVLDTEITATQNNLEGARKQSIDNLLASTLSLLNMAYVINNDPHLLYTIAVTPLLGGEVEYSKLQAAWGSQDTSALSVGFLTSYLGVSLPWSFTS